MMQVSWSFTISQSSLGDAFANAHTYVDGFGNVMELFEPHINSMYQGRFIEKKECFLSGIAQTTSPPKFGQVGPLFLKRLNTA